MKKEWLKKLFIFIIIVVIFAVVFVFVKKDNNEFIDTVKYEGKTYVLLEYNMDIFTYNFNSNNYYEEDIIHPVFHNKWDIVYFNGDLFVLDKQIKEATKYYADDKNYEWFIVFDEEDSEVKVPISISKEELKYLYNIEDIKETQTMTFDDIKQFANIVKDSKDGLVYALISLVHYEDSWYWKTEIMTDNDREYIVELPYSLNSKIFELIDKK